MKRSPRSNDIWQRARDGAFYGAACFLLDYPGDKSDETYLRLIALQADYAATLKALAMASAMRRHRLDGMTVRATTLKRHTRIEATRANGWQKPA